MLKIRLMKQYLLLFTLIFLCIVFVLFPINNRIQSEAYSKYLQNAQERLDSGLKELESQMDRFYYGASILAKIKDYQEISKVTEENAASTLPLLRVQEWLKRIMLMQDECVAGLYVQMYNNRFFVSNGTCAFDIDLIWKDLFFYQNIGVDEWRNGLFEADSEISFLPETRIQSPWYPGIEEALTCVVQLRQSQNSGNADSLAYILKTDEVLRFFADDDALEKCHIYLYSKADSSLLMTSGNAPEVADMNETCVIGREEYRVLTAAGNKHAISVCMLVPEAMVREFTLLTTRLERTLCIVGICGLLLMLVMLVLFNYIPLRRLVAFSSNYSDEKSDSGNSFDYIHDAIERVINAKNQVDQRAALMESEYFSHSLINLCVSGFSDEYIMEMMDSRFSGMENGYYVLYWRAFHTVSKSSWAEVETCFREWFDKKTITLHPDHDSMIMIVGAAENDQETILNIAQNVTSEMKKRENIYLGAGVSLYAHSVNEMHEACIQALGAIGHETGAYAANNEKPARGELVDHVFLSRLYGLAVSGNAEDAERLFQELNACFSVYERVNLKNRRILEAIALILSNAASAVSDSVPEITIPLNFNGFVSDSVDILKQYALDICRLAEDKKKMRSENAAQSIINYISRNYADAALSGDRLSDEFHISKSRIQQLIKEATGMTMADYIEHTRVEAAKEMLKGDRESIEEIAKKSGFSAINTFYRVFKKHTGMPPAMWRENEKTEKILFENDSSM